MASIFSDFWGFLTGNTPPTPAPAPKPAGPVWLTSPYYVCPKQVYVLITLPNFTPFYTLGIESYLQQTLAASMTDPGGYINGSKWEKTPADVINNYVLTAQERAKVYPPTAAGMTAADLAALGTKYGNMALDIMKHIPASVADGPPLPGSVYDQWVAKNS